MRITSYRAKLNRQKAIKICNKSYFFNRDWYLNVYSDVRHAGDDPASHYVKFGANEGRDPGPYFSTKLYFRDHPQVKSKGLNPLVHFENLHRKLRTKRHPYQSWIKAYDCLSDMECRYLTIRLERFKYQPVVSIILPVGNTNNTTLLEKTLESVVNQLYPNWELCIAGNALVTPAMQKMLISYVEKDARIKLHICESQDSIVATANRALQLASGEFLGLLDETDELSKHALCRVVEELNADPDIALIYSDEDCISAKGKRTDPYFKSGWNPDLLHGQDFISHLTVYRHSLVKALGGFQEEFAGGHQYDLALRVIEVIHPNEICHIPDILYHRRIPSPHNRVPEALQRALQAHFVRQDRKDIQVVPHPTMAQSHRVIYPLPPVLPLVSIIIPTKDRLELLQPCIESVMERTDYPNFEVIIIDNQSNEEKTHAYFEKIKNDKIKVVSYPHPFNFSKINNFALPYTRGELLLFLNNDIKVISPHWLSELVSQAIRPEIGIVGAKLYYPNNTIQHAGVIGGLGSVAGHIYCHFPRNSTGYKNKAMLTQNFLAVTAACMIMRRSIFQEVGGYDEQLAVDFNDVDLCLRVYEKGYRILWSPFAELYHFESATRGKPTTPEKIAKWQTEIEYIRRRWDNLLLNDPFYNPNLTLLRSNCSLSFPPRKGKDSILRGSVGISTVPAKLS